jgi:dsRNA-specific ribonuclease
VAAVSYKMILQEYMQKRKHPLPIYTTIEDPDNSLLFLSTVEVCGRPFKGVPAKTKKQAEANAAKVALDNNNMEERK